MNELLVRKRGKPPPPPAAPAESAPAGDPTPPVLPAALEGRPLPPAKPEQGDQTTARKARTSKARPALATVEDPPVRPERCAHCNGTPLESKDVQEIVLIDHVRCYVRRRVLRRIRCRCADGARDTTPPAPPACPRRTHFTAAFVAFVLYAKLVLPCLRSASGAT